MKTALIKLIYFIGLPDIYRIIFQKNKTTIIYYHNISKDFFFEHLNFLKKKYSIISLDEYLENKAPKTKKYRLIITLDDGYKENKELQEVLSYFQLSATIFLTAGIINSNFGFWFKSQIQKEEKERLKKIPNKERIRFLLENNLFKQDEELVDRTSLNLDEINSMKNFSFGSHSMYHPCLGMCTDDESKDEIYNSKKLLEKLLEKPIDTLAFPDGSFGNREVEFAKTSGYKAVLTSEKGFNEFDFSSFSLKRFSVNDSCSIHELYLRTTGIWFILRKLFR